MSNIVLALLLVVIGFSYDRIINVIQSKWNNKYTTFFQKNKGIVISAVALIFILIA